MTATLTIGGLTVLLLLATGLSFLRVAHGFVRVFAFPRLQILVLSLVLAALAAILVEDGAAWWLVLAGLAVVIVVQLVSIAQFSPLRPKQSAGYRGDPDGPNTVSILSSNIKMSNRRYDRALALAASADPDIALFMETDGAWVDALMPLRERYPHVVAEPLDNAYGMVVFSKFPLEDVDLRCLVMDGIPSIRAKAVLPNGEAFRLHCVHPEPPVPHVDSLGRDAELLRVADIVKADRLPSIVTGDLNDVAWSHTTRLFQRMSRLLDPRIGRGFYNTFDSRYPFLRWPLDHLFHDARFELIAMRRLPHIGSDHFPMFFKLALTPSAADARMPAKADAEDREEAAEIKTDVEKIDRDPIGVNWET